MIWDLARGRGRFVPTSGRVSWLTDELLLDVSSKDALVRRARDGQIVLRIGSGQRWQLSSDARFLAVIEAAPRPIRWFDLQAQTWVQSTRRPMREWRAIAFSSDRRFAWTLEADGSIYRWRLR